MVVKFNYAMKCLMVLVLLLISVQSGWCLSDPSASLETTLHQTNPWPQALNQPTEWESYSISTVPNWYWLTSALVPGMGQMLLGDFSRGFTFLLTTIFLAAVLPLLANTIFAFMMPSTEDPATWVAPDMNVQHTVALTFWALALSVFTWNVIDAYVLNQEKLMKQSQEQQIMALEELQNRLALIGVLHEKTKLAMGSRGMLTVNYKISSF